MRQKANHVVVKPRPRDKVLPSGIIIPETVKDPSKRWGVVVQGGTMPHGDVIKDGDSVLYGGKNFVSNGEEVVSYKNILYVE